MKTKTEIIKYAIVGLSNTAVTATAIWILTKCFGISETTSNFTGYIAGLVNSFVWNKQWTFRSDAAWLKSAVRFAFAFALSYIPQYFLLIYLNKTLSIDPYYNQLIAMAFYTVINFVLNKFFVFKGK